MNEQLEIRPPNALIVVGDPYGDPPEVVGPGLVWHTSSSVAVGTREPSDAATTLRVTDDGGGDGQPEHLVFDGTIETADGTLTVESVVGDVYLTVETGRTTAVRIWADDLLEPDEIVIRVA